MALNEAIFHKKAEISAKSSFSAEFNQVQYYINKTKILLLVSVRKKDDLGYEESTRHENF